MIEVDCYQCKSNKNELYDTENGHNLVKCLECGLLFLNPRPGLEEINEASLLFFLTSKRNSNLGKENIKS